MTGWGPCPGQDGAPTQDRMGYPLAMTGWGTSWSEQDGVTPGQERMGSPPRTGWNTPPPQPGQDRVPTPPPHTHTRTKQQNEYFAPLRVVCRLPSRRRTVLLLNCNILITNRKLSMQDHHTIHSHGLQSQTVLHERHHNNNT